MSSSHNQRRFSAVLTLAALAFHPVAFAGGAVDNANLGTGRLDVKPATDATVGAEAFAGVLIAGGEAGDNVMFQTRGLVEGVAGAALDVSTPGHYLLTYDDQGRFVPWTADKVLVGRWLPRSGLNAALDGAIELELAPVQVAQGHQTGSGQIAPAAASATVAVGAAFDGLPVAVLLKGAADATLAHVTRYEWDGAGNLTVHGDAAATAAVDFTYIVFIG